MKKKKSFSIQYLYYICWLTLLLGSTCTCLACSKSEEEVVTNSDTTEYVQIKWKLNGGSWTDGYNYVTQIEQDGTLVEPNIPVKVGNSFDGWYKEEELTNKITFPYVVSSVSKEIIFYAKWKLLTTSKYYIDNVDGDDDNDGLSPATAWKSLDKVNNTTFVPGDYILFKRGGSWTGQLSLNNVTGTETDRITFSAYGSGEQPKLVGNTAQTVLLQNPKNVTFENFDISNRSTTMPPKDTKRGIYITIKSAGIYPNVVIKNNYIHDIEGQPITNRHMQAGLFVRPEHTQGYFKNFVVEDNKFERCSSRGILFGDNGQARTYDYYNDNIIIRNNDISYTALEGILLSKNSKTVLVEYNKIFHAGAYALDKLDGVLAGLWGNAKDVIIQHNEVAYTRLTNPANRSEMDSEAFDIDFNSPGYQIIQYNYSHDNEGGFFLSMGDPGPDFEYGIIRYNISQNDGHPEFDYRTFELHGHPNGKQVPIYVYNNVFYNDVKISVQKRTNNAILPGIEFQNNIFSAPVLQFDDQEHIRYENNLYHQGEKAKADQSAIVADPQFVSGGNGSDGMNTVDGYQLKDSSPVIGTGIFILNNGGFDFWGNIVSATEKPAIGAFQP